MSWMLMLLVFSAPSGGLRRLSWTVGPQKHQMQLGAPQFIDVLGESRWFSETVSPSSDDSSPGDEEGDSTELGVLSVVGPMRSWYEITTGYHGAGGWNTEHVRTEMLDGYSFNLRGYLTDSGQLPKELLSAAFDRFWFVSWDGAQRVVLGVETLGCEMQRSSCRLETNHFELKPPSEWLPWLRAAAVGEGLFQADAYRSWVALSQKDLGLVRRELAGLQGVKAKREWIRHEVYQRQRAPLSAAELVDELAHQGGRSQADLEVQWAAADHLLYLVHASRFATPIDGPRNCATTALARLEQEWQPAPGKALAFNAFECALTDPSRSSGELAHLRAARTRCERSPTPVACARSALEAYLKRNPSTQE